MLPSRKSLPPRIECLEDRTVPATFVAPSGLMITQEGGLLLITANPAAANDGNVELTLTGTVQANKFDPPGVVVQLKNAGFTQKVSNISVIRFIGDNEANSLILNLNGFDIAGDVNFAGGKGDDTFTLNSATGSIQGDLIVQGQEGTDTLQAIATFGADVKIRTGFGNDTVSVGGTVGGDIQVTGAGDAVEITVSPVDVTGDVRLRTGKDADVISINGGGTVNGSVNINSGAGDDTVQFNADNAGGLNIVGSVQVNDVGGNDTLRLLGGANASTFSGRVGLRGYNVVEFGEGGGNLTFNAPVDVSLGTDTMTLSTNFLDAVALNSSLSINGGTGADSVAFSGLQQISGTANVNLRGGDNTFIASASFATLLMTAGSGADHLELGTLNAGGNAYFLLGEGDNTYNLDSAFSVTRNLTISSGSADDNIGTVSGSVGGNLTFSLSDGNNAATLGATANITGDLAFNLGSGDNTLADAAGFALGGSLRVRTMGGASSYTANRAAAYALDVFFDGGDDTFTYGGAGADLFGMLSGGVGTNTFNAGTADTTNLRTFGF